MEGLDLFQSFDTMGVQYYVTLKRMKMICNLKGNR